MDSEPGSNLTIALADQEKFLSQLQQFLHSGLHGKWCVASIDIEHFKLFNEWYGIACGDALLARFSGILQKLSENSGCPVGYFGNDDFFACLPDDQVAINELCHELQACINEQVGANNMTFFVVLGVCSIAPGLPAESGEASCNYVQGEGWICSLPDARTLCNYAQIAVMSRSFGSGYICRFELSMLDKLRSQQKLLTEIRRGLDEQQFCVYLQPKCNSMTHRVIGMEALVRWQHPERGIVAPGEFVPVLERSGQITQLDRYIWETVCQILHRWQQEKRHLVPISVNVSMADISSLNVGQVFAELVDKYKLEPKFVSIEITESMMAQNTELVQNTIQELHRKGFIVLMDDFGSGYSSLNMLKDTSVDVLKLDMKFVDLAPENREKGEQIIESVVEMAHRLSMPVIVEGVESQEQVFMLQSMDCLYVQGYYFYRPLPVEVAERLLSERPDSEAYWDLRRDMTLRDHQVLGGNHVSERTAIALQTYQIIEDNVLELSRLNLITGEYVILRRSPHLPGRDMSSVKTLSDYCEKIIESGNFVASYADILRRALDLSRLRSQLFTTRKALSTRFRNAHGEESSSPVIASILPCTGCSEKDPWAAILIMELPET